MTVCSIRILRWWPYKFAFVALVVLPFLAAIAISEVPALTRVGRCFFDEPACLAGGITTAPRTFHGVNLRFSGAVNKLPGPIS